MDEQEAHHTTDQSSAEKAESEKTMNNTKMVEVPLANGMTVELPEGAHLMVNSKTLVPEPKSNLPKGVGAVLRWTDYEEYSLTRVSPTEWIDHNGVVVDEELAKQIFAWDWIYVASEGVDPDREPRGVTPVEPGDE
ncbi:hypothetical protein [Dermacoccus nishinomiyaensis]|uniref:hypothetical protein n=1 Tax=Dermacoccus nishinomiyaensis TaxID=1274 RepID=UPI00248E4EE3|nr:hypothetical protein [Dermacoccus nishinomiyaensis]